MIDLQVEFKDQTGYFETDYLLKGVLGVQSILRKLFFGVNEQTARGAGSEQYLVKLIEELLQSSECTLNTVFRVDDLDGAEDEGPWEIALIDSLPDPASAGGD